MPVLQKNENKDLALIAKVFWLSIDYLAIEKFAIVSSVVFILVYIFFKSKTTCIITCKVVKIQVKKENSIKTDQNKNKIQEICSIY